MIFILLLVENCPEYNAIHDFSVRLGTVFIQRILIGFEASNTADQFTYLVSYIFSQLNIFLTNVKKDGEQYHHPLPLS